MTRPLIIDSVARPPSKAPARNRSLLRRRQAFVGASGLDDFILARLRLRFLDTDRLPGIIGQRLGFVPLAFAIHWLCSFVCSWASRLTLLVVEVRVQRLLDISEQDAEAEGVCHFVKEGHRAESFKGLHGADRTALVCSVYGSSRIAFRHLWETLNGSEAWNANPWVAAVSFTVHRANIDQLDLAARAA